MVLRRSVLVEKMRVHILAKELNVPSKTIVEKCHAEGIDTVKNHMSTLSAGLHATICEWFSEGSHNVAIETSARVDLDKVRIRRRTKKALAEESAGKGTQVAEPSQEEVEVVSVEQAAPATMEAPVEVQDEAPVAAEPSPETVAAVESIAEPPAVVVPEMPPVEPEIPQAEPDTVTEEVTMLPAAAEVAAEVTAEVPAAPAEITDAPRDVPEETPQAEEVVDEPAEPTPPERIQPVGPQHVPAPAKLQGRPPGEIPIRSPQQEVRLRPFGPAARPCNRGRHPGVHRSQRCAAPPGRTGC